MNAYSVLFFAMSWFSVAARKISNEEFVDLDKNLSSWHRLKRDAGYFTESGVYRGGLWRDAKATDSEVYSCLDNRINYCRHWTTEEESKHTREHGTCTCIDATARLSYCTRWTCETTHVKKKAHCTGGGMDGGSSSCEDVYLSNSLTCACDLPAANENYCAQWSCSDVSSDGYSEAEDYRCLEEDVTGEYCYSWKGNISSSYEIESSFCQCRQREDRYCHHWACRERSLTRCAAHFGGWCSIELGIGLAGGLGLVFILLYGRCLHNGECAEESTEVLSCITCGDSVLNSRWFSRLASHFGCQDSADCFPYGKFLKAVIVSCLAWLSGVLIWGGIDALIVVLPVWFFAFLEISRLYGVKLREERIQIQMFDEP